VKTLVCKVVGLCLAVAGSLAVGKVGEVSYTQSGFEMCHCCTCSIY
jgi:hypothetical protein